MNAAQLIDHIGQGALDARLCALYGADALQAQRARYQNAVRAFAARFGEARELSLFSVPGRSELSGNHTDHNRGCVIAAAVDRDIIAVASKNGDGRVRVLSEGFPEDCVTLAEYTAPAPARFGRSDALIAGVCAGFSAHGYQIGGFDAYTTSDVPKGSGLSSSAAFENMIGNIENHFYNEGRVAERELAHISQYAENVFFGKPCGLMDQMASAVGSAVAIDFGAAQPEVEQLPLDLDAHSLSLCIVNTGGNHADLTPDYAAVPTEMHAVARALGKQVLREVEEAEFLQKLPQLREALGDRAVLRAIHFFGEQKRVAQQRDALKRGDISAFFAGVTASGRSSYCYLQNVYSPAHPAQQGISLALALAEAFLTPLGGVCRVHGGGFAGTVQAFLPSAHVPAFTAHMDAVFGAGATTVLRVRASGAVKLL